MTEGAIRTPPSAAIPAAPWWEIRFALVIVTVVVAVVELLLLRVATRTFTHIPGMALDAGPLAVVADAGRFAYFMSVVLVVTLLGSLAFSQIRAGHSLAAAAITLFVVAAAGARVGLLDPAGVPAAVVLAVILLAGQANAETRLAPPAIIALAGAVVINGLWAIGSHVSTAGVALPEASTAVLPIGETLALIGLAVLPLSFRSSRTTRRFDGVTVLVAVVTGLAVFMGLQLAGPTIKILLLWNLGLAGYLPPIAYAVAAAGVATGVAVAVRTGQTHLAAAIVMLLAGGFALTSTYQSGLVIAAFGILAIAPAEARRDREPMHMSSGS